MPFNSATYHVNKWRRERADNMAMARDAKHMARIADNDKSHAHYARLVLHYVRSARMANTMLRSAIRLKDISIAPLAEFMPGGRYYEESNP